MPKDMTIRLDILVKDLLEVKELLEQDVLDKHLEDAQRSTDEENQRWLEKSLEERIKQASTATGTPPGWWQWGEERQREWLVQRAKNTQEMLYDISLEEVYGVEFVLPTKYEMCGRCRGEGVHDPEDWNGFTGSEWAECEPEFREDYLDGRFDVQCTECSGKRVVPVVDESQLSNAQRKVLEMYEKDREADWEYDRVAEAERRMGA